MASSLEGNKILAAILTAGVIATGSGVLSGMLYGPEMPEENAYKVEVAAEEGGGDGGGEPEAAPVEPIEVRLASADPAKGQTSAKVCSACHSFEQGGANKVGPNLWSVVNADIAAHEGYSYSPALSEKEGSWDYAALDGFLLSPKGYAAGTKMTFAGIADPGQRADIIAYLRSLAETPAPLPEAPQG